MLFDDMLDDEIRFTTSRRAQNQIARKGLIILI